ncbi:hypothetical protein ACSQ67_006394 [Phaseolus vulgaris]
MVVGGVFEADLINEEHSNVIPCRSEKYAAHINDNIGGANEANIINKEHSNVSQCRREKRVAHINGNIGRVENLQDKHGTMRHKVVGGVNEAILINEEHPNENPRRSEAHATYFYSCNGGVAKSKDEQGLVCHKRGVARIVSDSKVGMWVDDWRVGLPDEYEVGGSVGPDLTIVEAEQSGEVVVGAGGYKRRM